MKILSAANSDEKLGNSMRKLSKKTRRKTGQETYEMFQLFASSARDDARFFFQHCFFFIIIRKHLIMCVPSYINFSVKSL